jgi:hypothetical protein
METNNAFISTLLEKETELSKQLEALKTTIKLFQNGTSNDVDGHEVKEHKTVVPKKYEDATTWNSKILFALGNIQSGFVKDIVDELLKHSKDVESDVLFKKVTALASNLKSKKILGAKPVGKKYKYFIK